jgi:Protein of unknown function (DUF1573)
MRRKILLSGQIRFVRFVLFFLCSERVSLLSRCFYQVLLLVACANNLYAETPIVELSPREISLGSLREGEKASLSFSIVNKGDGVLVVQKILTGCGCLSVPSVGQVIQPHSSITVPLVFSGSALPPQFLKVIRILTNDPKTPAIELPVKGEVMSVVKAVPARVVIMNVIVGEHTTASEEVTVFHPSSMSLSAVSSDERILVIPSASEQNRTVFRIGVAEKVKPGRIKGRVVVYQEKLPLVTIPVLAVIEPALQFDTRRVNFGVRSDEHPLTALVRLRNRGLKPITKPSLKCDHGSVVTSVKEIEKGFEYEVSVSIVPSKVKEYVSDVVKVVDEDTSEELAELPVIFAKSARL